MIKRLPLKAFLKSFKYAPRVAINLFITNNNGGVLLSRREEEPFKDYWHFPGSFLIKGEKINECIQRILKDELGVHKVYKDSNVEFMFISENLKGDPRGHVIDLVYKVSVDPQNLMAVNDTKEIQFFKKLPERIGFNHREVLNKLGYK